MQSQQKPGFLHAFIGSFVQFHKYPEFSKRSLGSFFGHYLLLVVLCCSLYAAATSAFLKMHVSPHLDEFAQEFPAITVTEGKATVEIEQPHYIVVEGETIAVIDTEGDPNTYIEEHKNIIVVSGASVSAPDDHGVRQVLKYSDLGVDFEINSDVAQGWVDTIKSWTLPAVFLLCFLWQVVWKGFQTLVVAALITLVQQSRPGFSVHLKLATMALCPAMMFGVFVYFSDLFLFSVPSAGIAFWAILGGLTFWGSDQLKKTPEYS